MMTPLCAPDASESGMPLIKDRSAAMRGLVRPANDRTINRWMRTRELGDADSGHPTDDETRGSQATASSVRFASASSRLGRRGELLTVYGPGAGAWSHEERISYWARPPKADRSVPEWGAVLRRSWPTRRMGSS